MTFRPIWASALTLALLGIIATEHGFCSSAPEDPLSKVKELLQMIAAASADTCDPPETTVLNPDGRDSLLSGSR